MASQYADETCTRHFSMGDGPTACYKERVGLARINIVVLGRKELSAHLEGPALYSLMICSGILSSSAALC